MWLADDYSVGDSYTELHTGSVILVKTVSGSSYNPSPTYVTKITNLKPAYTRAEQARFRTFVREKDWSPTIYTKASSDIKSKAIEKAYFKIYRIVDEHDVIHYGTGSDNHTKLSFDISGNYFDLDMSLLEKDYAYGIKFLYYTNDKYIEQPEAFKFRVE